MLILGDWGTSRLRLYAMNDGQVTARADGPGIGQVGAGAADALRTALAELKAAPTRILLCGMAGARGALVEAPYAACPVGEFEWDDMAAHTTLDGTPIAVTAGLKCRNFADAPDVMRGEECQVFGALRLKPTLARGRHLIVHPGTHAKWIAVEDGRVTRFHSFMSGELFALLTERSTLLKAGGGEDGGEDGFAAGLHAARGPARTIGSLFAARAAQLLEGRSAGWARQYLSGLLIGGEVRLGCELAGGADRVVLIGEPALTDRYAEALAAADVEVAATFDGEDCAHAGLTALAARA